MISLDFSPHVKLLCAIGNVCVDLVTSALVLTICNLADLVSSLDDSNIS